MATDNDLRPVVVAFDGSAESIEAVRTAGALFAGRPAVVVTVWEPGLATMMTPSTEIGGSLYVPPTAEEIETIDEAQHDHAEATAQAGAKLATEAGATAEALSVPDEDAAVAETLARIGDERDAAALVVGSRGLGRVKSALLGSTTSRLLHDTRRPVLVVRLPDDRGRS